MRILLTGASGGIGSTIKDVLIENEIIVESLTSKDIDLSKPFIFEDDTGYDGLIHCAGKNVVQKYSEISYDNMSIISNINTNSFITLCKEMNFNKGSNIVAIGSIWSTRTKEGRLAYTMSKHALYGAVKTLSLEMSEDNIKVNMISPGFVDTEMTRANNSKEKIKEINDFTPLGMVPPQEIANLCMYMVSKNKFITGQNIIVDGGYSNRSF
jgi:3-oxoacyl-[acyl-carrier protein] reductase